MSKIVKINSFILLLISTVGFISFSSFSGVASAEPAQCFIPNSAGQITTSVDCDPNDPTVIYDNGSGANILPSALRDDTCFVQSPNLYGGNIDNTGMPFVQFDCGNFECDEDQELRYERGQGYTAPSCIDKDEETEIFVDPPAGGSLNDIAVENAATDDSATIEAALDGECKEELSVDDCGIIKLIVDAINALTVVVGVSIIGSIMWAGFQYMTARDNQGQIQKAKIRIVWAIVALGTYIFMYAILNYVVPGGVI